jgi:hypothetical protein
MRALVVISPVLGLLFAAVASAAVPGLAHESDGTPFIAHIGQFLDGCPDSDPATPQIRRDFQIRRNGAVVDAIGCTPPVSQVALAQYTDELIVLQSLRVIFYMDRGHTGHLPWTAGALYDWMKTRVQGVDIRDDAATAFCCYVVDDRNLFVIPPQDELNRQYDRRWDGISGNIGLYAHETRHMDNQPHAPCGDPPFSKDQLYDEHNLSAYGVQYWLNKLWLTGEINVGMSCLPPSQAQSGRDTLDLAANNIFHFRFCDNAPPLVPVPETPGGVCRAGALPSIWKPYVSYAAGARALFDGRLYEAALAHGSLPGWTPTVAITLWFRPTPSGLVAWETQTKYGVGSEVMFGGVRYRAITAHVSQSTWTPPLTPALWQKR